MLACPTIGNKAQGSSPEKRKEYPAENSDTFSADLHVDNNLNLRENIENIGAHQCLTKNSWTLVSGSFALPVYQMG